MPQSAVTVNALWDDEAKVYVASSDDVPGLVTEAPDLETLMRKLRIMVPELLEANNLLPKRNAEEIPLELIAHYSERLRLQPA
jgi:predicted RNase H-like HicB family nuclease